MALIYNVFDNPEVPRRHVIPPDPRPEVYNMGVGAVIGRYHLPEKPLKLLARYAYLEARLL
jgi:hypothetical protein